MTVLVSGDFHSPYSYLASQRAGLGFPSYRGHIALKETQGDGRDA